MWTTVSNVIPETDCDFLVKKISKVLRLNDRNHFVQNGKTYFQKNLIDLIKINDHIENKFNVKCFDQHDAIHHAFLLYKQNNGSATELHQDRSYWENLETRSTMFTCWIALEKISSLNATLKLDKRNYVKSNSFKPRSDGILFSHVDSKYLGGESSSVINNLDEKEILKNLQPITLEKGDMIVFDSFEPHASTKNSSNEVRKALKVVYSSSAIKNHLVSKKALNYGLITAYSYMIYNKIYNKF